MDNQKININLRQQGASNAMSWRRPEPGAQHNHQVPPPAPETSGSQEGKTESKLVIKVLEKIMSASIFMIFLGVPLFFTGLTFQGLLFEKQIYFYFFLLLALISWAAKGVIIGEMDIRRTPLDIPIIGFWLAYLAATFFSVDRWHSFWGGFEDPSRGFMNITALIIAYYLIFSNFNKKMLKMILSALIISITFVTIWTVFAILNIKFLPDKIAAFSPVSLLGSISGLTIFFSMAIPLLMVSILKLSENEAMNKTARKVLATGMLLVLLLNLILILALYSFVPWSGLFVGIAIFLVFILSKIVRPKFSWTWLPMVVFVAVMVLKITGAVSIAKINLPIEVSPNYQASWEIANSAIRDKFILGSGPSTYTYDFSKYRSQDFNLETFYNLRFFQGTGIFFEAIPTIGAAGTFFLVLLALSYLGVVVYLISKEKEKNKLYSLGIFSASIIFLVDIVSIRAEGSILILAVLVGTVSLAAALMESGTEEKHLSLSLKASPKFALALAFIFMVVSAGVAFLFVYLGKVYAADIYAGKAAREAGVDQQASVVHLSKAIQLYDKEGRYYTQLGQYYMVLANTEAMKGEKERDIQKIQQYLNFSIGITQQGGVLMKNDVVVNENMAQIYENAGLYVADSMDLASQAYQKGLELEPHNPVYFLKLGQIKVSLAATKKDEQQRKQLIGEAKDLFQKSVDQKNNFDAGYYQLALTQEALGDIDGAIENATKAIQINSQNNDYILALARIYQDRGKDDDMKTAEQLLKALVQRNDSDVSSHFYLGLLYEKMKNKQGAKDEYKKVITLLPAGSDDTKKQLEKMISNIDAGIENTPQNLGLVQGDQGQNNDNSGGAGQ